MSTTVQVAARTGLDDYSKPIYGAPVTYQAHLQNGVRDPQDKVVSNIIDAVQVHLNSARPILATSQLTLSTGDMGSTESYERQPRILAVDRRFDGRGAHHTVIYAGWAPRNI